MQVIYLAHEQAVEFVIGQEHSSAEQQQFEFWVLSVFAEGIQNGSLVFSHFKEMTEAIHARAGKLADAYEKSVPIVHKFR